MPRKITLNTASGAPASTGLTTAEVNALIAADNAKYEPQWELVESRDIAPGENPDWTQLVFDRDLYKNYEVKLIFNKMPINAKLHTKINRLMPPLLSKEIRQNGV